MSSNVLNRVIHLRGADCAGTGFFVHVDGREYVVTARHLAEALNENFLDVSFKNQWVRENFDVVGHCSESDVSVICFNRAICSKEFTVILSLEGLTYGQEVFFLGFPFGLSGDVDALLAGLPLPFVKRATVSNIGNVSHPELSLGADFWLDGINNIGFSGGPVVWGKSNDLMNYRICGIVCSYYLDPEPVRDGVEQTTYRVDSNTGLILAASIDRAIRLIEANPIGPVSA